MTDKGLKDKVSGSVKEAAGDLSGDKKLKTEGILEKAAGKAKEVANDVKDVAEGIGEKVKDAVKKDEDK